MTWSPGPLPLRLSWPTQQLLSRFCTFRRDGACKRARTGWLSGLGFMLHWLGRHNSRSPGFAGFLRDRAGKPARTCPSFAWVFVALLSPWGLRVLGVVAWLLGLSPSPPVSRLSSPLCPCRPSLFVFPPARLPVLFSFWSLGPAALAWGGARLRVCMVFCTARSGAV